MKVSAITTINASKENIWSVITDIEHSMENISGINGIEILEKPENTIVGLKWKETRTMFGKEADETMWITDAVENEFYKTRAESHGAVYISRFDILENGESCDLTMSFEGTPQSFMGRVMNIIFGAMMKKSTLKAIEVDLDDIKRAVESKE